MAEAEYSHPSVNDSAPWPWLAQGECSQPSVNHSAPCPSSQRQSVVTLLPIILAHGHGWQGQIVAMDRGAIILTPGHGWHRQRLVILLPIIMTPAYGWQMKIVAMDIRRRGEPSF